MHVDHIIPLARGGDSKDPNNLQCLCKKCHFEKTRDEQQDGYIKLSETQSSFNKITHKIFNSSLCNSQSFVERLDDMPQGWDTYKVHRMDINKCRKNQLYYSKYQYPLFTVMDQPVEYQADRKKRPGLYYVECGQYFPMRGNGWYSQPMIEYCLKHELIHECNIKYVLKASLTVKSTYFNEFIYWCYKNLENMQSWLSTP